MRGKYRPHHILEVVLLFIVLSGFSAGNSKANENSKYLNAVREFADNVLKYGRDTYGPKHTPLFVDGLNIHTHEPVKWISPEGERWILSNLASQQNLFRTLDGLTKITGDPKYRQAAMDAIKYAFENLRAPNGLLYWGGHQAYDAAADKPCGRQIQEFKSHYPYYELMWQVDPKATEQFIEALWSGHIYDWSNLDMNRESYQMSELLEKPWEHEYKGGPVFFQGSGSSMICAGSDLFYAGGVLFKLSGEKEPLIWSKRLANRYAETRNPLTGIGTYTYDMGSYTLIEYQLGEDFDDRSGPEFSFFPGTQEISSVARWCANGYRIVTPGVSFNVLFAPRICALLLGEMLGEEGKYFNRWALEELAAWGKVAYRKGDNSWIPMFTDGTSLQGYVFKKGGYFGPKGAAIEPIPAIPMDFWGYSLAYRVTGDSLMWQMARDIARGHKLGDIGVTPDVKPQLNMNTDWWQPYTLLGFIELHKKSRNDVFLQMAERIGHNLLGNRFHKGYFVPSRKHTYTKFDSPEPLVLLQLYATANGDGPLLIPQVWPNRSFFSSPYRLKDRVVDNDIIYGLIDSTEPPLSLQEAAAKGDVALVKHLAEEGIYLNARGDGFLRTSLHHAVLGGHKGIAELLLVKGADVDAKDSYACSALYYAAEKGYTNIAELLIANGADVNATNAGGYTPLQYAAYNDHKDIIKLLLEKGATIANIHIASYMGDLAKLEAFIQEGVDINALDNFGYAPLHYAAQNGLKEAAELLVAKRANINIKNWGDQTPLDIAVSRGHNDIIELLLSKGVNINTADNKGNAPIHHATEAGRKDIVELLIANGADINTKNDRGQTPLDTALAKNRKDIIDLLIEKGAVPSSIHAAARFGVLAGAKALLRQGADINVRDEKGMTPLHYAIQRGHKELVELLIANGADINGKDKRGYTSLYYAVWNKDRDMVKFLVTKGADVHLVSTRGSSLLSFAAFFGYKDIAELLVAYGARFDVKDEEGWTAFRYAADQGHRELVEFFVAKGADVSSFHMAACVGDLARVKNFVEQGTDVDTKDELGWTPLCWAVSTGQKEVAEFLIVNCVNINVETSSNSTPLHQAAQAGSRKLAELLISRGAEVDAKDRRGDTPLHKAVLGGHGEVVELLIVKGANVDEKNRQGLTPLYRAVQKGRKDVVEVLIDKGADIDSKVKSGQTPLHYTTIEGRKDMAALLIAKGADVNSSDVNGETPLHLSARQGHSEVARLLVSKGADVNVRNKRKRTPLDLAINRGHDEIAKLLRKQGAK